MNTKLIGAYISRERKKADMTQLEFAEELNVKLETVTKWETGKTVPELLHLPKIADVLMISLDKLLSHGGKYDKSKLEIIKAIVSANEDKISKDINNNIIELEALIKLAPMIKPSSMDKIVLKLDKAHYFTKKTDHPDEEKPRLKDYSGMYDDYREGILYITSIAPYVSEEVLVKKIREKGLYYELPVIFIETAPYIRSELLMEMLCEIPDKSLTTEIIIGISPYIKETHLFEVIRSKKVDVTNTKLLLGIVPFISENAMKDIIMTIPRHNITEEFLEEMEPFVDIEILRGFHI